MTEEEVHEYDAELKVEFETEFRAKVDKSNPYQD